MSTSPELTADNIILFHQTTLQSLYSILTSGGMLPPKVLKELGMINPIKFFDEPLAIYFSPIYPTPSFSLADVGFYIDFKTAIERYPSFFINDDNYFRPMTGNPKMIGPKGNKRPSCNCEHTYNQNLDVLKKPDGTNKYPPIDEKECFLPFERMLEHIKNTYTNEEYPDFVDPSNLYDRCHDGGMEIGFITERLNLEGLVKRVVVENRASIRPTEAENLRSKYGKPINELYEDMKNATESLGGVFEELGEGAGKRKPIIHRRKMKRATKKIKRNKRSRTSKRTIGRRSLRAFS